MRIITIFVMLRLIANDLYEQDKHYMVTERCIGVILQTHLHFSLVSVINLKHLT